MTLIEIWREAETELGAYALDGRAAWALTKAVRTALFSTGADAASSGVFSSDEAIAFHAALEKPTADRAIDRWLEAYFAGCYDPLSQSSAFGCGVEQGVGHRWRGDWNGCARRRHIHGT